MSKKSNADNHANQLNPNNTAYRQSRGVPGHPAPATDSSTGTTSAQPQPAPSKKGG